jgi:hypothetical protein
MRVDSVERCFIDFYARREQINNKRCVFARDQRGAIGTSIWINYENYRAKRKSTTISLRDSRWLIVRFQFACYLRSIFYATGLMLANLQHHLRNVYDEEFWFLMEILNARSILAETWSVFYDEITVRTHMVLLQRSTQSTKPRKFLLLLFSFHTKESFAQEPSREERAWNQNTIDSSRGPKEALDVILKLLHPKNAKVSSH